MEVIQIHAITASCDLNIMIHLFLEEDQTLVNKIIMKTKVYQNKSGTRLCLKNISDFKHPAPSEHSQTHTLNIKEFGTIATLCQRYIHAFVYPQ